MAHLGLCFETDAVNIGLSLESPGQLPSQGSGFGVPESKQDPVGLGKNSMALQLPDCRSRCSASVIPIGFNYPGVLMPQSKVILNSNLASLTEYHVVPCLFWGHALKWISNRNCRSVFKPNKTHNLQKPGCNFRGLLDPKGEPWPFRIWECKPWRQ